jgi:hypothetical protein
MDGWLTPRSDRLTAGNDPVPIVYSVQDSKFY